MIVVADAGPLIALARIDDWMKMDLEYIENWSLWLDFKILLRTAWVVVTGTGS